MNEDNYFPHIGYDEQQAEARRRWLGSFALAPIGRPVALLYRGGPPRWIPCAPVRTLYPHVNSQEGWTTDV